VATPHGRLAAAAGFRSSKWQCSPRRTVPSVRPRPNYRCAGRMAALGDQSDDAYWLPACAPLRQWSATPARKALWRSGIRARSVLRVRLVCYSLKQFKF